MICKRSALLRCEGTIKIRTTKQINTAFRPGRRLMRRVTLGTVPYRLNRGQVGYGKIIPTRLAKRLLRKHIPLKVDVFVTVLDEQAVQQTLRRTFTLRFR